MPFGWLADGSRWKANAICKLALLSAHRVDAYRRNSGVGERPFAGRQIAVIDEIRKQGIMRTSYTRGGRPLPAFKRINGYTHQRTNINVGHPALIWHRAHWMPSGHGKINDLRWEQTIQRYISHTFDRLVEIGAEFGAYPTTQKSPYDKGISKSSGQVGGSNDRRSGYYSDLLMLRLFYSREETHEIRISVSFEIYDEFWSSMAVIDFSRAGAPATLPPLYSPLLESLFAIELSTARRFNRFSKYKSEKVSEQYKSRVKRIYEKIAKDASDSISNSMVEIGATLFPRNSGGDSDFSEIISRDDRFADFVGLSLGVSIPSKRFGREVHPDGDFLSPQAAAAVTLPRVLAQTVSQNISPNAKFDKNDTSGLASFIDAVWPFVKFVNPSSSARSKAATVPEVGSKASPREFTVSLVNRARTIYITSLGAINSTNQDDYYRPLSYLMISPHRATWQLGRIIDRIHMLGLFRLATFWEYGFLEVSNNEMRKLVNELGRKGISPRKADGSLTI